MTIEIAQRLVNLRKQHGLSQEALAEKLYVSRQAVSKWERAEASPDTDNLIALARLYGISLDELLNVNPKGNTPGEDNGLSYEEPQLKIEDGHMIFDEDHGDNSHKNGIENVLKNIPITMLVTVTYLILGFAWGLWHPGWIVFLLIPVLDSVRRCILNKNIMQFCYPILITIVFLLLGFTVSGAWAWSWVLFLSIPMFYSIARMF